MGVAAHLGIDLGEYHARIRTFIPGYDAMLDTAAGTLATMVPSRAPLVIDLGIGTGALAERCLSVKPRARIVGIDEDEGMLAAARARLGRRLTALPGSFETVPLPPCDAVIASLALHHIPTPRAACASSAASAARSGATVSSSSPTATSPPIRASSRPPAPSGSITCATPTHPASPPPTCARGRRRISTSP